MMKAIDISADLPPVDFEPWAIPPIWRGQTVVCVASGPSLTLDQVRQIAIARLENRCRVIACAWSGLLLWDLADWWHTHDIQWFDENSDYTRRFQGIKTGQVYPPEWVPFFPEIGVRQVDFGSDAQQSGPQAIWIAAHTGAARIVLLGYDGGASSTGQTHWFLPPISSSDRAELQGVAVNNRETPRCGFMRPRGAAQAAPL